MLYFLNQLIKSKKKSSSIFLRQYRALSFGIVIIIIIIINI